MNSTSKKDQKILLGMMGAALVVTAIFVVIQNNNESQQLSKQARFADCLTQKGVILYGSDTCQNCQLQKSMFGDDFRRIHYINCDIHQDECNQKDIQGYPTWMYNGQSFPGIQTFGKLADLSSCTAP